MPVAPNSSAGWNPRRWEETEESLKGIRRGWRFGREQFKGEMLERIEGQLGDHHSGALKEAGAPGRAERIMAEELQRLGWTGQDYQPGAKETPKSSPSPRG